VDHARLDPKLPLSSWEEERGLGGEKVDYSARRLVNGSTRVARLAGT
jgi:hypothetical protein